MAENAPGFEGGTEKLALHVLHRRVRSNVWRCFELYLVPVCVSRAYFQPYVIISSIPSLPTSCYFFFAYKATGVKQNRTRCEGVYLCFFEAMAKPLPRTCIHVHIYT